jgi:RNA polymerase sigma-70 factor (ECF subfamily)
MQAGRDALMAGDITVLLARWHNGDKAAFEELLPIVYSQLRELAGSYMRRERAEHTLQPTALVHEAYLRLAGVRHADFHNRVHFFGAAAQAMRRILVDHARRQKATKRDRESGLAELAEPAAAGIDLRSDLVALDEALSRLAETAPQPAKVVELRYFGGMTVEEAAEFLDISPSTVKRHWIFARAWLQRALAPKET